MRYVVIASLLIIVSGCGKNKHSASTAVTCADTKTCETFTRETTTPVQNQPTEFLDAQIDVPIRITTTEILFDSDATESEAGVRTSCGLSVKSGDHYQYAARDNELDIFNRDGKKMTFKRTSFSDHSLTGTWVWRGYEGDTYKVIQFSFIGESRLIMKSHCEI